METKDIKPIIAKNLTSLRKQSGLTQAELASKLNYSDKAVSRWEHGDTLPDINVLYQLCDFYGIDMNTLVSDDEDSLAPTPPIIDLRNSLRFRVCIFGLAVAVVWIVATIIFLYSGIIGQGAYYWMAFVWAIPVSSLLLAIFSQLWNFSICTIVFRSTLCWSLLATVYLQLLISDAYNVWMIFLIGVPVQATIILWALLKRHRR